MLNLRQMDSIVHNTLLIFKGFEIKRREEGTNIFYDVRDHLESVERFLGTYRVWEWHDGGGRSGWMPFDTNDSETMRIRHMVWEAIMAIAVPANQSTKQDETQSFPIDEKTRESIVNLSFASVKDEIEKYLWKRGLESKLSFEPIKIELPEGQAYNISHLDYGEFGQLSIHPRGDEIRFRFTKSIIPSQEESLDAAVKDRHDFTKKPGEAIDWLFRQREKQNEAFYTDFLKHLEEIKATQVAQINAGKAKDTRQRGKSGRPNLPADIWAWEQVNNHNRPMNEVYKEWIIRNDVQARKLQDPNRQFNRITKPAWGNKSGQNI